MSWVRVDDSFYRHEKRWEIELEGIGLWLVCLCYAADQGTDGFVPAKFVQSNVPRGDRRGIVKSLVEADLWERVDGGFQIVNYLVYQRSHVQTSVSRSALSEKRSAAGRKGGIASAKAKAASKPQANGKQTHKQNSSPNTQTTTPPTPSAEFREWLGHHEATTGHRPPRENTKAFAALAASFQARFDDDGLTLDELKLATVGAHADDYRRQNGYDTADSVLRPTKIAALISRGEMRQGVRRQQAEDTTAAFIERLNAQHGVGA